MLDVRVGFMTSNVIAQFDEVLGKLAKTADDQCDILTPDTVRHQLGVHPVAWIPGVEFFGVLLDESLSFASPRGAVLSYKQEYMAKQMSLPLRCGQRHCVSG